MEHKFTPEKLPNGELVLRLVIPEDADEMENFCLDDWDFDGYPIPDLEVIVSVRKLFDAMCVARANSEYLKLVGIDAIVRSPALGEALDFGKVCILNFPDWFSLQLNVYNHKSGLRYYLDLDGFFYITDPACLPQYLNMLLQVNADGGVHAV